MHVTVNATYHGYTVTGQLTGNGAGKYTGLLLNNGKVLSVLKSTVEVTK
jgi:hypothetical protein